ncbi:MAG: hypothetical protein WAM04_22775, partial [Candidatus Sulfotelmatobacter sp.]
CPPVLDITNVGWMAAVIGPSIVRTPSDLASRCDSHRKYCPFIGLRKRGVRLTPRTGAMVKLGASEPSQSSTLRVAAVTTSAPGFEEKNA